MKRIHLIIAGDVQGVGYRAWVRMFVRRLNLTGWVRNRSDGAVEIVAEGAKKDLELLIKACHGGPEVANVQKVQVEWEKATGEFVEFAVVY